MIHNYSSYNMPYKVTLQTKDKKIKLVYYKSTTEFLSFDDTRVDVEIQQYNPNSQMFFSKKFC